MMEPRFYVYNNRSREFLRYRTTNSDGRFKGLPRGTIHNAWTPGHLYAREYERVKPAWNMARKINTQLGADVCEVVATDMAIKIERDNAEYWEMERRA